MNVNYHIMFDNFCTDLLFGFHHNREETPSPETAPAPLPNVYTGQFTSYFTSQYDIAAQQLHRADIDYNPASHQDKRGYTNYHREKQFKEHDQHKTEFQLAFSQDKRRRRQRPNR